jgi:UDP-N-acetylmuramyl tripeptide synthase
MIPELTESRRLTGANLFWDHPSAIIDIAAEDGLESFVRLWLRAANSLLNGVGYSGERTCYRLFEGGASLLISAPIDVLYSMCELNEAAFRFAAGGSELTSAEPLKADIDRLKILFQAESCPALLALQAAARGRDLPFLWDDDEVSIGYGKGSTVWPRDGLPAVEDLDWSAFSSIPVALVSGTNGKSTTVRMTAAIMTAAGYRAGLTSTDFIRVADRTIDTGDYSGTGGARMLMRQDDVEMAVLEVARGGLLRRGLGVEKAQAALVTNVASDHLGEYGINTVEELVPAKFIVRRALQGQQPLILNADDDGIRAYAAGLNNRLFWFSLEAENPVIRAHLADGGQAAWLQDEWLVAVDGKDPAAGKRQVANVMTIPATRRGVARYNISNALGAMSIALSLGLSDEAIRKGLAAFRGDEQDNPGRGNWFEHNGVQIVVDFAHNEHGMLALADVVRRSGAERIVLLMGQAGDRRDRDIEEFTNAACSMQPDRLLVCDFPGYERGREPFAVAQLICDYAQRAGVAGEAIELLSSPVEATRLALKEARPGDLLVLLTLAQRNESLALVHEYLKEAPING